MRPQEGVEKEIPSEDPKWEWEWEWAWGLEYGNVGVVECRVFGVKSIKSKQQNKSYIGYIREPGQKRSQPMPIKCLQSGG